MGKGSGVNEGQPMSRRSSYFKTLAWALLALVFLYPMLWMALSSFKSSNVEIFGHPFSLPHQISLTNYQKAVRQGHLGAYFINSLWVTGLSAAAVVCFGAWAGFALSKARFPFRKFWLALLFIVDPAMKTLPVGMIAFEQAHNTDYPALLAGLSLISVPTLLVYAIFNKQVIRGVIAGAVK